MLVKKTTADICSWGRIHSYDHEIWPFNWRSESAFPPNVSGSNKCLAFGLGRSYGDSCLNQDGTLVSTSRLNRIIDFDFDSGVLRCEAGTTLADLNQLTVRHGWFVGVTPGTKYITVGGAVANDVHGKNHHSAGTFGKFVRKFELARSDGSRKVCSKQENRELFEATIAGLGLTGIITWIEIQLRKISSEWLKADYIKFGSLDEFFEISRDSSKNFEYTVSWIDCVARKKNFGRGIFMRANICPACESPKTIRNKPVVSLGLPVNLPSWTLNRWSVAAFNSLYFARLREKITHHIVHYEPFFYPLDSVTGWNKIYGKRGLYQFQVVVPCSEGKNSIESLLKKISASGAASFLAVLKEFGTIQSPGMLSFPRPGITLALDFANRGVQTLELLSELDNMTAELGGAIYPAKDATMAATNFKKYYPNWREFSKYIDPMISSSFWRRVNSQ